jgi:hypothetical protein
MAAKLIFASASALAIATGVATAAPKSAGKAPAPGTKVTVTGCPAPGTEPGCLTITGKNKVTYGITSADPKPDVGKAIRLTGTVSGIPRICLHAVTLDNITWTPTKAKCPAR